MDRITIGGRPHLTLMLYTTLEVAYAMAVSIVAWLMFIYRWGLGDGSLEHGGIPRPPRSSQGSSSRPSGARKKLIELNGRKMSDFERKLANFDKAMIIRSEFRPPPQVFPQVPPNLFNAPINQGPPLGAPQGWVGPNAPEFRAPQFSPQVGPNYFVTTPTSQGSTGGEAQGSQPCNQLVQFGQGSQPQQWTYPTQGPTFGDASQPPPQWMYPGNPMMMYGGQQPMFYPGADPPAGAI
ncbi:hypothetical protein U9M48_042028 [Paspalum notatum var. saurae]|uniref:Uncharacterized protein n=1 Tax=Paspalum notatum var. saurae TaxID=547442 RepID=A0AAQ3UTX0_PASNO